LRLHYLYPTRVTDELLQVMAGTPKICAYFDMPLQHANNRILKAMQRIGDKSQMQGLIERIKTKIPKASIRSTFIIGFPDETDREFDELLDFLKEAEMDYVGFFPYSREEGTAAAALENQVPEPVKDERLAEAQRVQEEIAERSHQKWVGEKLQMVVESVDEDGVEGRTQYQAPEVDGIVLAEELQRAAPGQRVKVEITHALGQDLVGKAV
jgi:ribosomal protein S12 methylthiotransferase